MHTGAGLHTGLVPLTLYLLRKDSFYRLCYCHTTCWYATLQAGAIDIIHSEEGLLSITFYTTMKCGKHYLLVQLSHYRLCYCHTTGWCATLQAVLLSRYRLALHTTACSVPHYRLVHTWSHVEGSPQCHAHNQCCHGDSLHLRLHQHHHVISLVILC